MATGLAAKLFIKVGLFSTRRSILLMVITWALNLFWLGINYFWSLVGVTVLLTVPVILLAVALIALLAYVYWGMKHVKEQDAPYANIMVGVIIALTLFYFNYNFLQFVLALTK